MHKYFKLDNINPIFLQRPKFKQAEQNKLIYWGKDVLERKQYIHQTAYKPLQEMLKAAANSDITIQVLSIFRSYKYQQELIQRHLNTGKSLSQTLKKVTLPEYSEHHTGLAIDFTTPEEDGLVTEAFEKNKSF